MNARESAGTARRGTIFRNALALLGSQAATWILTLGVVLALSRSLGTEGLGQIRLGQSIWVLCEVLMGFGAGTLLMLETARDRTRGPELLGPAMTLSFVIWLVLVPIVFLYTLIVGYATTTVAVIMVASLGSLFAVVHTSHRQVLYGLDAMSDASVADVVSRTIGAGITLGLLGLGASAYGVAWGGVAASAVMAVFVVGALRRVAKPSIVLSWSGARDCARRSRGLFAADAALVCYQQVDVIIISILLSETEVGIYAAAVGLFGTLLFVPNVVVSAALPTLTRLHHESAEQAHRVMRRALGSSMMVALPIGAATVVLGPRVVDVLYGADFEPAGTVLSVMGVVLILTFPAVIIGRYATIIGRQGMWARWLFMACPATVVLDLILVPYARENWGSGAVAGAVTFAITEAVILVMAIWRIAPGLLDRWLLRRVALCGFVAAASATTMSLMSSVALPIVVLVGAVQYCAVILVSGLLDDDERAALRRLGSRLRRPPRRKVSSGDI